MNIRYETRNGRTYAYRSTSKRVPGKANPVSVKEYLGVVDPETGEIREKNARAKPRTLPPDGARIVDYGDALIVYKLAERSGLIGDLEHVFGDRAPFILAISLAQAVSPVSSDMIDSVLNSSYITEFVGLDGRMSFYKVREAINSIQNEEMNLFFRHRWERNPEKLYAYAHLMNDSEKSSSSKASISVLMILSQTGAPMGFSLIGDVSRDTTTLRNILLAIRNISECVFIADTEISQTLDISGLVMDGLDNPRSRLILETHCESLGVPIVHGAIRGWNAQVAVCPPGSGLLHRLYSGVEPPANKSSLSFTAAFCAALRASASFFCRRASFMLRMQPHHFCR